MTEIEAYEFCEWCGDVTVHLFAGSGKKGTCMSCGHDLPPAQRVDFKRVISGGCDDRYAEEKE